jgi:hypothetical protein
MVVVVVGDVEVVRAATEVDGIVGIVGIVDKLVFAETDGGFLAGGFADAVENPPVIA